MRGLIGQSETNWPNERHRMNVYRQKGLLCPWMRGRGRYTLAHTHTHTHTVTNRTLDTHKNIFNCTCIVAIEHTHSILGSNGGSCNRTVALVRTSRSVKVNEGRPVLRRQKVTFGTHTKDYSFHIHSS